MRIQSGLGTDRVTEIPPRVLRWYQQTRRSASFCAGPGL